MTPFDSKCQTLQTTFFIFVILAKDFVIFAMRTILADRYTQINTHAHRNEECHGNRRNLAGLPENASKAEASSVFSWKSFRAIPSKYFSLLDFTMYDLLSHIVILYFVKSFFGRTM